MPKRTATAAGLKTKSGTAKRTRTYKKKTPTKRTNTLVLSGANRIMPEVYHNVMEVMDTTNTILGTGIGLYDLVNYTLNGLYDYTTTVGNASVPGFNFLAPIYRNYRVKGVKFMMSAVNNAANPIFMQLSVVPSGNTNFTTWATVRQLTSNKWSKSKLLSPSGGQDRGTLSIYVPFKEFVGPSYTTDEDYVGHTGSSGTTAGNPSSTIAGRAYAVSADGGTQVSAACLTIDVSIIYYVEWFALAPLNGV